MLRIACGGCIPTPRWLWSWLKVTKFIVVTRRATECGRDQAVLPLRDAVGSLGRPFACDVTLGAVAGTVYEQTELIAATENICRSSNR